MEICDFVWHYRLALLILAQQDNVVLNYFKFKHDCCDITLSPTENYTD